jgi:hypothetical protein
MHPALMPVSPSSRSCFQRHLVNGDAFCSTEHLPPASGRPPTVPILGRCHRANLLDTFRPPQPVLADFLLWARPPWAPPAATGEACLDPMSLPGFCNHAKGRAHRANVRTSHRTAASSGSEPGPLKAPDCERQGGSRCGLARALPAEVLQVSLRAAATEAHLDSFERPIVAK